MSGKASNRMRSTGTSPSTEAVHHAPAAWPIWRTGLAIACGCNRPAESLQLNDRQTTTHPGRYISLPSAHSSAASSWPIPTGLNPIWRYDQWLCHQLLSVHNRGQLKHLLLCNCYLEPRLRLHRAAAWVVSPCAMRRASSRVSMRVADCRFHQVRHHDGCSAQNRRQRSSLQVWLTWPCIVQSFRGEIDKSLLNPLRPSIDICRHYLDGLVVGYVGRRAGGR